MNVVFRADAGLQIGTGHVMRCLTLADALSTQGAECHFICRAHEGTLAALVRSKGYAVHELPIGPAGDPSPHVPGGQIPAPDLAHGNWLGATQAQDAGACVPILDALCPDWVIVDHYGLDVDWERTVAPHCGHLMAIDDLADRRHACDLLLDQTFGRDDADYRLLVPSHCRLLCGSQYALLRPDFAVLRSYSLQRRARPELRELMITMGGVDRDNATGQVLEALRTCSLPSDCQITVVMGATAPWIHAVRRQAEDMPRPTRVLVGVSGMAQLMADSDLAIGAPGATSWERCCLGLPTIMVPVAENQLKTSLNLEIAGAGSVVELSERFAIELRKLLIRYVNEPALMSEVSERSAAVSDGRGTERVSQLLRDMPSDVGILCR